MYYVFDVDGTLTPSRGSIDPEFCEFLISCAQKNKIVLVTGSDRDKTVEQIGLELFNLTTYSFNCAGNEVYQKGQSTYKSDWVLPDDAWLWLENELYSSEYKARYGRHFEQRTGLLNFSVVGRKAGTTQRTAYYEWDKINNERNIIAKAFNKRFPNLTAQIGGETGIDIFPKGKDKSQILDWFEGPICFFGDRMDPEGNDRPLAERITNDNRGASYAVRNWKDTWHYLKLMNLIHE